jgi:hypothetical protein
MRLTRDPVRLHELGLEDGPDAVRAFAAIANEPDSAARQPLDRRDADILLEAPGDHRAFVKAEKQRSAHDLALRLAAARASRAVEYR